ncbi:MAG: MFS transporter [Microbacterium sp.]|uniref:MFS transporter n=1 Tax=Microbacterium sp. TaxID=51671 RepID=UPI003D6E3577
MVSLIALAAGIFISQTAEFLPGGLVPQIADDLELDVALVGQMVSVFAFTVVLATAPLALVTGAVGRKTLVVTTLAIVSLSNVIVFAAPDFGGILTGRIIGALAHGLFWAVVATYAVEIVPREKLGRAMAITAAGGSLSGILGIPIGNALGELLGWRQAFLSVAVAGVVVTLVLWRWLPRIENRPHRAAGARRGIAWDRTIVGIAMICVLILILVLGQTSFGPFTTVWLEDVAGLERSVIPVYLLVTGIAGAIGAFAAGHLYDRYPRATFASSSILLALALCAFPLAASASFPALLVVAICSSIGFAGLPMMLQTRMMHTASPAMRRLAGAVQTVIFNVAIGGGAVIGGLVVSGVGVEVLPWVAAGTAVATGVAAALWDAVNARRGVAHSSGGEVIRHGSRTDDEFSTGPSPRVDV